GGFIEDTCTSSTIKLSTANTGGSTSTVGGDVTLNNLTWTGCNLTTDTTEGGSLEVHNKSGTDNGTITAQDFEITIVVLGVSCSYTAGLSLDIGTFTGGSSPSVDINTELIKRTGSFLCPSNVTWGAQYAVTTPSPVYVEPS